MLRFDPSDSSFNLANALYLAHAADIAYHRKPSAAADERLGLMAYSVLSKLTRLRGFLGVCDTHAVLSFRGSDPVTLPNWLTDAVVKLVQCIEYEGKVHFGFSAVLNRSWKRVEQLLDHVGDRPLFVTGHSMGGALAILTASRLARDGRAPAAVYTYGSPRVGDPIFCEQYQLPTYRIVNKLDVVPETPMSSLTKLLPAKPRFTNEKILSKLKELADRVPCYGHVNTLVHIDHDGVITPGADVQPWKNNALARAIASKGMSFHEGLTDHMISNYIKALEGKVRKKHSHVRRRKVD